MWRRTVLTLIPLAAALTLTGAPSADATVPREDERAFIVDTTGERWEVTHAESVGFEPGGFQFGGSETPLRKLAPNRASRRHDVGRLGSP